ncbi:hypothetical protein GCM10028777_17540 [Angustibacter speluncae]
MTTLHEALTWSGSWAELLLFAAWPGAVPPELEGTRVGAVAPTRVRGYELEAPDDALGGLVVHEVDVRYDAVPDDLEDVVRGWLTHVTGAGARVAWFGFEASFGFDHLLDDAVADQVYAVADASRVELALDDERRTSPAWARELASFRAVLLDAGR